MKLVLKRIFAVLVALVFLVICTGIIYQQIASWPDARRFPQQGKSK